MKYFFIEQEIDKMFYSYLSVFVNQRFKDQCLFYRMIYEKVVFMRVKEYYNVLWLQWVLRQVLEK